MAFSTLHRGKNDAQEELIKTRTDQGADEDKTAHSREDRTTAEDEKKPAEHTGSKLKDPNQDHGRKRPPEEDRRRQPSVLDVYPDLPQHIEALFHWCAPTFGSPTGGPIHIDKAMRARKIAEELMQKWNENISSVTLYYLLPQLGYSKMVNQKEK